MQMLVRVAAIAALLCIPFLAADFVPAAEANEGSERWEEAIREFERQDRENPAPKNGILFLGSSSIRMWPLEKYFPERPVINRGFGGSEIADSVYFADRIVIPYEPKVIVFFAGGNDIARGKSPERVYSDFKAFDMKVKESLPETKIICIAIKPSIARWKMIQEIRALNALIRPYTEKDPRLQFVDIDPPMIGPAGTPKPDLFIEDGLHLNAKGYALWTRMVMPFLNKAMGETGAPRETRPKVRVGRESP